MKNIKTRFETLCRLCAVLVVLVIVAGCTKKNDTTPTNPYGANQGEATFWASNPNASFYPITVTVGGVTIGEIGGALSSAPDCQNAADRVVKFVNQAGTYNFTCIAAGNAGTWTGSITVTSGGCYLAHLQ